MKRCLETTRETIHFGSQSRFSSTQCLKRVDEQVQHASNKWLLETLGAHKHDASLQPPDRGGPPASDEGRDPGLSSARLRLPQSPLTDPGLTKARLRHKYSKQEAPIFSKLPLVRKRLEKNPYAQALVAPVRHCRVTAATLPEEFLLGFGLVTNPQTQRPWILPRVAMESRGSPSTATTSDDQQSIPQTASAAQTHVPDSSGDNNGTISSVTAQSTSEEGQDLVDLWDGSTASELKETSSKPEAPTAVSPPSTLSRNRGAGSHAALSYNLMGNMSRSSRRSDRLASLNWQDHQGIKANAVVWRKDMQTFVLKYLRQHVLDGLQMVSKKLPNYLVPCDSWEAVGQSTTIGAILWFPPAAKAGESRWNGKSEDVLNADHLTESPKSISAADVPPTYAMYTWRDQRIPVHNIPLLMGPSLSNEVEEMLPRSDPASGLIVLQMKRRTTRLLMDLWKLTGYMAEGSSIRTFDEGTRPHEARESQDETATEKSSDDNVSPNVESEKADAKPQTQDIDVDYIGWAVPFVRSFTD